MKAVEADYEAVVGLTADQRRAADVLRAEVDRDPPGSLHELADFMYLAAHLGDVPLMCVYVEHATRRLQVGTSGASDHAGRERVARALKMTVGRLARHKLGEG